MLGGWWLWPGWPLPPWEPLLVPAPGRGGGYALNWAVLTSPGTHLHQDVSISGVSPSLVELSPAGKGWRQRDRVAWPGDVTWVDCSSAQSPAVTPSPCCCLKSSSTESTNVIPRHPAGWVYSQSPTKENPIKAVQPGVPTGWDPGEPAHCLGGPRHAQALSPRQVHSEWIWKAAHWDSEGVRPVPEQPHVLAVHLSLAVPVG